MGQFFNFFFQISAKISSNLRTFLKNQVILLKIWSMNGLLFLEKLVFVWVFFQIPRRHIPTKTKLEYPPGSVSARVERETNPRIRDSCIPTNSTPLICPKENTGNLVTGRDEPRSETLQTVNITSRIPRWLQYHSKVRKKCFLNPTFFPSLSVKISQNCFSFRLIPIMSHLNKRLCGMNNF